MKSDSTTNAKETIGAVVIGRNEAPRLERCLQSVLSQVERHCVIYVDSGSTDESVAIAHRLGVHVHELDGSIPFSAARARNEGFETLLKRAGPPAVVQFIDGDCELAHDWISQGRDALERHAHAAIVCGILHEREPERSIYHRMCQMEWSGHPGEIEWCGGIFMVRASAYAEVGGMRSTMLAGEEPELCVRLRDAGWTIQRINVPMATHEAQIVGFPQWWRRSVRTGYGWTELAAIHGRSKDLPAVKQLMSILAWGFVIPAVALDAAFFTDGLSLLLLTLYPLQWLRIMRKRRAAGASARDGALYATFTLLAKSAGALGVARYFGRRIMGGPSHRCKAQTTAAMRDLVRQARQASSRHGRSVAYLNSHYPSVSHTFIEREIAALREEGVDVIPFSVRPGERFGRINARAADETIVLLDSMATLLLRSAGRMMRHPVRAMRAIICAQRLSQPGVRERLRHLVYAIEAARLAVELRTRHLNHVHVHMANNGAMVALLACVHDPAISYSLSIHGSAEFFNVDCNNLAAKAERALFVRCISNFCRSQVMAWSKPEAWERYHVVRCGIDPGETIADDATSAAASHRPLRLITVGRLHPIKGYAMLLRACSALRDHGLDWTLDLIGDGPERARLNALARELMIADRVRFHGALPPEQTRERYRSADIMVMSSFMEGVPVVLMEAMAAGLPVIATRVGGIPELVDEGISGLLVSPASAEQLTDALCELGAASRDRRAAMGRAGRERVMKAYALDRLGRQMSGLFEQFQVVQQAAKPTAEAVGPSHPFDDRVQPGTRRRSYVLISPCRNEAASMRETLDSVLAQTVQPSLWIIVDDGSSDASPRILDEYAAAHEFIQIVRRTDRGRRSVGPGVVDAVNAGLEHVDLERFEYLCKLDLDLRLPPRYFELLIERMEADERLGTCSGKPYFLSQHGRVISERIGDDVSAGMTKFYRTRCFQQMGGFVREVMWDGIDCHRCRMIGWRVRSWDDPELRFLHLRPMGSSQRSTILGGLSVANIWSGRFRHGRGQWFMGTSPVYMAASALFRMTRPPLFIGGVAMMCGYIWGMVGRRPQYPDAEFRRFLRAFQHHALVYGKGRAVELLEARARAIRNDAAMNR